MKALISFLTVVGVLVNLAGGGTLAYFLKTDAPSWLHDKSTWFIVIGLILGFFSTAGVLIYHGINL